MRHVRDDHNFEWTVYQVERLVRPLGKHSTGLLPEAYLNGWLVFQSSEEKRRLAPCPRNWEQLPEATLRSFLAVATPARPSGSVSEADVEQALRDAERA